MNMYGKNMYSKGGMAKNPKKMAMGGDVMTTGVTRGTGAARKQTFRIY
jgi:hypothetical protein